MTLSRTILGFLLAILSACTSPGSLSHPPVVFMTDFGTLDDAVSICKGVMWEIHPRLRIVDLTHDVRPFAVIEGARYLANTSQYYPAGTVFVSVIDPGVGTHRKRMILKTRRSQYFIGPDNGLSTLIADRDGIASAREITNLEWIQKRGKSVTFDGRDVFCPGAARIARGEDWELAGPLLVNPVRLNIHPVTTVEHGVEGSLIALDGPYGNIISNIEIGEFEKLGYAHGDLVSVEIGRRKFQIPYVKAFGDVNVGKPLLYVGSDERIAFAVNQGHFANLFKIQPPQPLLIEKRKAKK